jgi:hypothetical protein
MIVRSEILQRDQPLFGAFVKGGAGNAAATERKACLTLNPAMQPSRSN